MFCSSSSNALFPSQEVRVRFSRYSVMISSTLLLGITSLVTVINACANHSPPQIPNSFLGTVEQGCTPGGISAVTDLLTDPSLCDLPLAPNGCDVCKLRLYLPESTSSRFLVQPLFGDFSTDQNEHIEATKCKCSEGCYFHQSSITKFGDFPLPNGLTATGTFSEPFACYSGSSMGGEGTPKFTFLIWCESDGGCPNDVIARYSFLIRFELFSPNRPATTSIFTAKVTSLPTSKCLVDRLDKRILEFLTKGNQSGATPAPPTAKPPTLRGECAFCRRNKQCRSGVCYENKCIRGRNASAKARCGLGGGASTCKKSASVHKCVQSCLQMA